MDEHDLDDDPDRPARSLAGRRAGRRPEAARDDARDRRRRTDGPSARVVLLRSIDARGVVFFTNRTSRKGRRAAPQPVRRSGAATGGSSGARFGSKEPSRRRRRGVDRLLELAPAGQPDRRVGLGAVDGRSPDAPSSTRASPRSEARFEGQEVPLPPFWGGYRLVPESDRVLDTPRRSAPRSRAATRREDERLAPRAPRAVSAYARRERAVGVETLGVPEHEPLRTGEPRGVDLRAHLVEAVRDAEAEVLHPRHEESVLSAKRELGTSAAHARQLRREPCSGPAGRARPSRTATDTSSRTPCRGTAPCASAAGRSRDRAPPDSPKTAAETRTSCGASRRRA